MRQYGGSIPECHLESNSPGHDQHNAPEQLQVDPPSSRKADYHVAIALAASTMATVWVAALQATPSTRQSLLLGNSRANAQAATLGRVFTSIDGPTLVQAGVPRAAAT